MRPSKLEVGETCASYDGAEMDPIVPARFPACLRMSVRVLGTLSRAKGALLVVDPFLRGWRLMKNKNKKKKVLRLPSTMMVDLLSLPRVDG
jgi:hypothetical protein